MESLTTDFIILISLQARGSSWTELSAAGPGFYTSAADLSPPRGAQRRTRLCQKSTTVSLLKYCSISNLQSAWIFPTLQKSHLPRGFRYHPDHQEHLHECIRLDLCITSRSSHHQHHHHGIHHHPVLTSPSGGAWVLWVPTPWGPRMALRSLHHQNPHHKCD